MKGRGQGAITGASSGIGTALAEDRIDVSTPSRSGAQGSRARHDRIE